MTVLSFDGLGQAYAGIDIFTNLKGRIDNDSRIGLVGPNGIGKTTLLQVLAGLADPEDGTVSRDESIKIGYLRQEAVLAFGNTQNTLHDEMLSVFNHVFEMEREMRRIEADMADGTASDDDFELYGEYQEKTEFYGLYDYARRIERTLDGLGFAQGDWHKSIDVLSGGQKTRALLAKLLLESPDLLILDEPTNHLDMAALRWLEGTLGAWRGALLIVSHDRYFLDRAVNQIWEMSATNIDVYNGNYSAYLSKRSQKRESTQKEWDAMMERFWQTYHYIERLGLSDTNAKGRFKQLTREVEAVQHHGIEAVRFIKKHGWAEYTRTFERKNPPATVKELFKALKSLESPLTKQKNMRLKLRAEERSGDEVVRGRRMTIGYNRDEPLFTADNFDLERGDVAAIIGPNGAGKSSLLKTLLKEIDPLKGYFVLGANVQVGYFAQAHDKLNPQNTVLEELMDHKQGMKISEARPFLAPYLFQGEDVFKPVSGLSGGERARLALAILALEGANLLLLDEPTNHLDIPAQEVLQTVLSHFDGTVILVSHDRYLVDRLASHIWAVDDGHLRVFEGGYQAYLEMIEAERADEMAMPTAVEIDDTPLVDPKLVKRLETQITSLEGEIGELETLLAHASRAGNPDTLQALSQQYTAQQKKLAEMMQEWEELVEMA